MTSELQAQALATVLVLLYLASPACAAAASVWTLMARRSEAWLSLALGGDAAAITRLVDAVAEWVATGEGGRYPGRATWH